MLKSLEKISLIICALFFGVMVSSCSSGTQSQASAYDANPFWADEAAPPRHHAKKAHLDFFDKVCDDHKGSFDCHYTDQ